MERIKETEGKVGAQGRARENYSYDHFHCGHYRSNGVVDAGRLEAKIKG